MTTEPTSTRPEQTPPYPPGWYPDGPVLRWWDGTARTEYTRPPLPPVPTSNAALWSVILGAVGLLIGPLTLLGLPLGLVALGDIRRGARTGKGLAIAGIVLNGLVWAFWLVVLVAASA